MMKFEALERVAKADLRAPDAETNKGSGVSALNAEQLIGGRWFAVVGALVVILGVTLGVKYAWDQGWLGLVHPWVKVLAGAGFGIALLLAGEIALRKINAWASAGLSAAGIGAIYASAYAAHVRFGLVDTPVAFALLLATALLGMFVAVRGGLAVIAVLSLIGGYLAPVLLSTGAPHPYFFSTYLVVLLASALALSAWQGRSRPSFHSLRILGWIGTGLLGTLWLIGVGHVYPGASIPFIGLVWALVHGERFAASRGIISAEPTPVAGQSGIESSDAPLARDLLRAPVGSQALAPWGAAGASISATVWGVGLLILVLERWGEIESWLAPGAFTAACLVLASVFAGHLRIIRDVPRTDGERIGVSLLLQSGALLIITMAMALGAWALVLSWLALGLAALACGRWINARQLDTYGLVLLGLGTIRLALLGAASVPWTNGIDFAGLYLTDWTGRFALTGAAWIGAAVLLLLRNPSAFALRSRAALAIGVALVAFPLAHESSLPSSVILAWLGIIGGLIALDRSAPRISARVIALIGCAVTLTYGFVRFPPFEWSESSAALGAHPALWLAAATCAVGLLVVRYGRWDPDDHKLRTTLQQSVVSVATLLMLGVTSLEVARGAELLASDDTVQNAVLSIYWGLFGAGLLIAGFWRHLAVARYAGLGLIAITTGKALIIDLAMVGQAWRIVSFLALGLLMLGVAVAYGKVTAALEGRDQRPATPAPPRL